MILQQFTGINAVMFYAGRIFSAVGYKNPNIPSFGLQAVQVTSLFRSVQFKDVTTMKNSFLCVVFVCSGGDDWRGCSASG